MPIFGVKSFLVLLPELYSTFNDYIPVYKISIQHNNPFQKIWHRNHLCYVRDGQNGWTGQDEYVKYG